MKSLSILALPMAIIGLECYSSSINLLNGGNPIESELKNCSADAVACLIGTNKTYTGQSCTNIQIPFTGCIGLLDIQTCYCTSNGCNESVEKAAAGNNTALLSLVIIASLSVIFIRK